MAQRKTPGTAEASDDPGDHDELPDEERWHPVPIVLTALAAGAALLITIALPLAVNRLIGARFRKTGVHPPFRSGE